MFSERQHKNAALASEAKMCMGYPSVNVVDGINKGRILNLPITKADLDVAMRIWGEILDRLLERQLERHHRRWLSSMRNRWQTKELYFASIYFISVDLPFC